MPKITNYGGATNGAPEPGDLVPAEPVPEPAAPDGPGLDPEAFSQLRALFS